MSERHAGEFLVGLWAVYFLLYWRLMLSPANGGNAAFAVGGHSKWEMAAALRCGTTRNGLPSQVPL